jgi:hypothetical protein
MYDETMDVDINDDLIVRIKELNVDCINPSIKRMNDPTQGGSKIVVIGKPGRGKTRMITSLLYEKRHIFPVGTVFNGTEDSNSYYKKIFPSSFVYNGLDMDALRRFISRQKQVKALSMTDPNINPWSVLLLDDVCDDPKYFTDPLFQGLFKNGRHWKTLCIMSLQYALDVKPVIRNSIDGTFLLKESIPRTRKLLYENYSASIENQHVFDQLMDTICTDYTAMYVCNTQDSARIEDTVFWYRAKPVPNDWRFGSTEYWDHHNQRYDPMYMDPLV